MKLSQIESYEDAVIAVSESKDKFHYKEVTDFLEKSHNEDGKALVLEALVNLSAPDPDEEVLNILKKSCETTSNISLSFAAISVIPMLSSNAQKKLQPWVNFLKIKSNDTDVRRAAILLDREIAKRT